MAKMFNLNKSPIAPTNLKMPSQTSVKTPGLKVSKGLNPGVKGLRKIKFPRPKLPVFGKRTFRE